MQIEDGGASGPILYTTGRLNALDNLAMVEVFLLSGRDNRWKWASLAMYHALYGYLLEALGGTFAKFYLAEDAEQRTAVRLLIQDRMPMEEIVDETNRGRIAKDPNARLATKRMVERWAVAPRVIGITEALDRMIGKRGRSGVPQRPAMVLPLSLTTQQRMSIDWLIEEIRNNFEHFMPKFWYIYLRGLATSLRDMLDAIEFIALESHGVLLCPEDQEQIVLLCSRIRLLLEDEDRSLNPQDEFDV